MKLSELLQGVEVLTSTAPATWDITGVAYDSREVQPGDVFVAISGFATDGNRYIDKAMARGARLVVTERIPTEPAPYVQVPSARRALAQMGANWYGHPAERMTMVGVTGTNGKTSVTLLLKSVLEQVTGARVGLVGTIQNMIGQEALPTERTTPESFALQGLLARMAAAGCRYVVMEVSSHALALDRVGGAPQVTFPTRPERNSGRSSSRRAVAVGLLPGARRFKKACRASRSMGNPGGTPSMVTPTTGPCDWPNKVNRMVSP